MTNHFEDEIAVGMQNELRKQASGETPDFVKAAECLHAALEIFEEAGLQARANDILNLLSKIAQQSPKAKSVQEMPTIAKLMAAGLTQRDLHEFSRGSPIAKAKFNIVLRRLGMSEHDIGRFIGHHNVMSEKEAVKILAPGSSAEKIWQWIQNPHLPTDPENIRPGEVISLESKAAPKGHKSDRHTKGLTPDKMVANIKHHGTPFNMASDGNCVIDVPKPIIDRPITKDDMEADFATLLDSPTFDIDASDDELMGIDIKEDSLEVIDDKDHLVDFEDD